MVSFCLKDHSGYHVENKQRGMKAERPNQKPTTAIQVADHSSLTVTDMERGR